MRFRRKVKAGITFLRKRMKRGSETERTEVHVSPSVPSTTPKKEEPPSIPVEKPVEKPKQSVESIPAQSKPQPSDNAVDPEKVAKHLARTRIGILRFVEKNGGTSGLAEMHDHSERRYFVGHKKFSDLMEAMVEEGVLLYSWETQEATITELGKQAIQS